MDGKTAYRLREVTEADREFLRGLHRATKKEYVDATWDERVQRGFFDEGFDPTKLRIVVVEGEDVGVISTAHYEETVELVTIRIAPAYQDCGIGQRLIEEVLSQAHGEGLRVELNVLKANPRAKKFYERLGFSTIGETDTHHRMNSSV